MSCPDCTKGGFLPGEPTGTISLEGAYFAAGSSTADAGQCKRAVLLLTDVFGLPLQNCKIIADRIAQELGCDVWIPDYFEGRPPFPLDALVGPDRAGARMGLGDWARFVYIAITNLPGIIRNRGAVVDARLAKFIATLQNEKKYDRIGAVGYCFGGATAIRLGSTGLVHSIVICHPGPFTIPQAEAIKIPTSWACAEEDIFFSPANRQKAEAVFAQRKGKDNFVEYEFQDHKGTAHGFACRPNTEVPEVMEGYENALKQTVNWFNKTLVL